MNHIRYTLLICALSVLCACSQYQPVKDVWKSTKGLWNTYVSQPASVDYEKREDLPDQALTLSRNMQGVDVELTKLERTMQNADKPPTQEWLDQLFSQYPWLNGFAGIKYDGEILGQQPPDSLKNLDFNPLLYEDKKQSSRALRTDIQPSPLGPEIMLATPLYDGTDFLGIVVAYFDMRSLMHFSQNPQDIVILAPNALLWPGKYDFAATPLAGVDWSQVVQESSAGTCSNSTGTFIYIVRYLGNLPLVFATPESGDFPEGNGGIEQGFAYFPPEREKVAPPELPARKNKERSDITFAKSEEEPVEGVQSEVAETPEMTPPPARTAESARPSPGEIQPGSRESVLLKGGTARKGRQVEERALEGENVEVERVQRPRRAPRPQIVMEPEVEEPVPSPQPMRRPSPFGPPPESEEPQAPEESSFTKPSPFGPAPSTDENAPAIPLPTQPAEPSTPAPDQSTDNDTGGEPLADGETTSEE